VTNAQLDEIKGNKSVIKALEILDYLGETKEPAHLKEIALALDLPESTVHRLLVSLLSKGYVRQFGFDSRYNLGWKFLTLTNSLGIIGQLPQLLNFHLRTLARDVKQSVNLSILVGKNVIYLDSINPTDKISMFTPPGTLIPAYASSMGKVLLSYLPNSRVEALFPEKSLERFSKNTLPTTEALICELDDIRSRGFAIDAGEYDENIHCVGAPIMDSQGTILASISISIYATNLDPDWYKQYFPRLLDSCKRISCELSA